MNPVCAFYVISGNWGSPSLTLRSWRPYQVSGLKSSRSSDMDSRRMSQQWWGPPWDGRKQQVCRSSCLPYWAHAVIFEYIHHTCLSFQISFVFWLSHIYILPLATVTVQLDFTVKWIWTTLHLGLNQAVLNMSELIIFTISF